MVIRLSSPQDKGKLAVSFVGIDEKAMWPGKKADTDWGPAMKLFEKLDPWLEEHTKGHVGSMLVGCVGGIEVV